MEKRIAEHNVIVAKIEKEGNVHRALEACNRSSGGKP